MDILDKFEAEFGNPNKLDWFARKCDGCGNGMNTGYMIDGCYNTCSEKCCRTVRVNLLNVLLNRLKKYFQSLNIFLMCI